MKLFGLMKPTVILNIYFEIPIDKKTSATKTLPTDAYNLKRKIVWNLSIKEDSIFFPLNRKYELKISA